MFPWLQCVRTAVMGLCAAECVDVRTEVTVTNGPVTAAAHSAGGVTAVRKVHV